MKLSRKLIMLLVMVLCIPAFYNSYTASAQAATPKFAKSKVVLNGVGESYQLVINNKIAKSKYKWTSSDKSVVKVTSKGLLTAISGGTATVRCKITYPSKSTKLLSCKVIVAVSADSIKISNAQDKNGAQTMVIGDTYQFQSTITPVSSTDKVFWSIGTGDKECIRIDDAALGKITAMKAGKVTLKATAAKDAKEAVKNGDINYKNDAIIIEVVAPKAEVTSAEITGPTEIKVVFDSAVDRNTIIDSANKLTTNIKLTLGRDNKNVLSADPGTLTPSLSTDSKTLTITTANRLTGSYGIEFTNGIKTSTGIALEGWYTTLTYIDTTPPYILNSSIDDTGMINVILFNEPIDTTGLKVTSTEIYNSSIAGKASDVTYSTLNNAVNYILSTDKKSLTLNMSKISPLDYGRRFMVTFSGIKDLSGLAPAGFTVSTQLGTDSSKKDQAVPLYVTRTAYKTLTATFSRALQTSGNININGSGSYPGVIDSTDGKIVHYTISDADALITGPRNVTITGYNSYNVRETDTSAYSGRTLSVDFTVDKNGPVLISTDYDVNTSMLTLTFNEDVNLTSATGIFSSVLDTIAGERLPGTNLNYTQMTSTDKRIVKVKITNMVKVGNYTFTIDPLFAKDNFMNPMTSRTITIGNATSASTELPGPVRIAQSNSNNNEINLEFINMLDNASAQTVSNYTIPGVIIQSAYLLKNTAENGATVVLTVAEGSINMTTDRPVTIKGVMGYKGSYSAITNFTMNVPLKENVKPKCTEKIVDRTTRNSIRLSFDDKIQGTATFRVTQQTSTVPYEIGNTVTVSDNTITINLSSAPAAGSNLRVELLTNSITDLSGNAWSSADPVFGVGVYY